MNVLIFKTDIDSVVRYNEVKPLLENIPSILKWTVDMEDIDKVLRVESGNGIVESEIENILSDHGFYCTELTE